MYTVDLNVGSQDGYRLYTLMNPILYTLLLWRFKFPYSKIKGLKFFRLRVYKLELVVTFINLDCSQRFFFASHIQNIVVRCSAKFFEQFPPQIWIFYCSRLYSIKFQYSSLKTLQYWIFLTPQPTKLLAKWLPLVFCQHSHHGYTYCVMGEWGISPKASLLVQKETNALTPV